MYLPYEENKFISFENDEKLGLSNYDLDYPFNCFINALEIENQIIPDSSKNPVISENDNIFVEINNSQDFSQTDNINDIIRCLSGRKRKNQIKKGEKKHDKYSSDNILRKINVHFSNFLISFINEVLHNCNINEKFNKINHEDKRKISKKYFYKMKNKTIRKLLILQNDRKFNDYNKNKKLYDKIFENNDNKILNRILNKRYIDIFKELYYNNNNKKNLIYEGMELNLSQTFENFLEEKGANKEIKYKNRIIEVVQKFYSYGPFIVKKYKNKSKEKDVK